MIISLYVLTLTMIWYDIFDSDIGHFVDFDDDWPDPQIKMIRHWHTLTMIELNDMTSMSTSCIIAHKHVGRNDCDFCNASRTPSGKADDMGPYLDLASSLIEAGTASSLWFSRPRLGWSENDQPTLDFTEHLDVVEVSILGCVWQRRDSDSRRRSFRCT